MGTCALAGATTSAARAAARDRDKPLDMIRHQRSGWGHGCAHARTPLRVCLVCWGATCQLLDVDKVRGVGVREPLRPRFIQGRGPFWFGRHRRRCRGGGGGGGDGDGGAGAVLRGCGGAGLGAEMQRVRSTSVRYALLSIGMFDSRCHGKCAHRAAI